MTSQLGNPSQSGSLGKNCASEFVKKVNFLKKFVHNFLKKSLEGSFEKVNTEERKKIFREANHFFSGSAIYEAEGKVNDKIRDHCHITGKYCAAVRSCS